MNKQVVDLTHIIKEDMPVFPGTEKPILKEVSIFAGVEFREKQLNMFSHTGTHMDAPYHMKADGKTLDQINVERFVGKVTVIDLSKVVPDYNEKMAYEIPVEFLQNVESDLKQSEFLLIKTDWDKKWGKDEYFENFPALSKEAAEYLVTTGVKGFGVDTISVDLIETKTYQVHDCLLGNEFILFENLCDLGKVTTGDTLIVLPLKVDHSDGSPIRAIALNQD